MWEWGKRREREQQRGEKAKEREREREKPSLFGGNGAAVGSEEAKLLLRAVWGTEWILLLILCSEYVGLVDAV